MKPHIFIDIETIPGQKEGLKDLLAEKISHPANMSKPETIAAWEKDKKPQAVEDAWRKTGFDGSFGEVISISWAINNAPVQVVHRRLGEPEKELLRYALEGIKKGLDKASPQLRQPTWVGHNVVGFDLRFLWQRCVVNNYKPPFRIPYDAKPWSDEIFDTLIEWKGLAKAGGTMNEVCFALGLDGKGDGIDGSQIWEYVQQERYEEIAEYNKDDVERTREMFNRMTFNEMRLKEAA